MNDSFKHYAERWKKDYNFKTLINAAGSFFITAAFALYNGFLGIRYQSVWNGCICVYYLLLAIVRGLIPITEKKNLRRAEKAAIYRKRAFWFTSIVILMMNLALVVPISLMVLDSRPVNMGLIPAIAMATYTTYKVTIASVNIKRMKRSSNILVRELRTINFIDALVSVLTLQNTLITVNKTEGSGDMLTLTAVSSAAIYLVVLTLSVWRIFKEIKSSKTS